MTKISISTRTVISTMVGEWQWVDLNRDGLLDVYLTANMKPNQLYINRGDLQFEDITQHASVGGAAELVYRSQSG